MFVINEYQNEKLANNIYVLRSKLTSKNSVIT